MKIKAKKLLFVSVGALLFVLVVAPAQGRQAQDKPERRTIPVSVVDKEGNFVDGMTVRNFQGTLKKEGVHVLSVALAPQPTKVLVVVDSSVDKSLHNFVATGAVGSVGNSWQINWRTGLHIASYMGASYPTALITLADRLKVEAGFTRDAKLLQTKLLEAERRIREETRTSIRAQDNTAPELRDGILDSLLELARSSSVQWQVGDVLFVVGTMEDPRSKVKLEEVQRELASRGIRLFCAWTNEKVTGYQSQYFHQGRSYGKNLAETSGGQWVQIKLTDWSVEKTDRRLKPVFALIRTVYQVEIEIPVKLGKESKWKLEVVDERGKKIKGLKVIYPRLLVPLETPAGK